MYCAVRSSSWQCRSGVHAEDRNAGIGVFSSFTTSLDDDLSLLLEQVEIANLRGYSKARLSLRRDRTFLVGPNNSGKTSFFLLLNWLINDLDTERLAAGSVRPTPEEAEMLRPARSTGRQARRLSLRVKVQDGRRHSKFSCDDEGIAQLRLDMKITPRPTIKLKLGPPRRSDTWSNDEKAIELLNELRQRVQFLHIPAFRDVLSPQFDRTLRDALHDRLLERGHMVQQGGTTAEYRKIKRATETLEDVANELVQPLWDEVKKRLPSGLAEDASLFFDASNPDVLGFLRDHISFTVTTGEHDVDHVDVREVGSGLQSLLDLAIRSAEPNEGVEQFIVAVEEPEAFLHPSAQRAVIRDLRRWSERSERHRLMVSTHSPIVVEEAKWPEVVLVRDQSFYEPREPSRPQRAQINTWFLSRLGSEGIFARSLLLVEGPGEREFFESLRRRLALIDEHGIADQLYVLSVGGKNAYAPWLRLLRSYGVAGDRPIEWIALFDSDAAMDAMTGHRDAGITIPDDLRHALEAVERAYRELRRAQVLGNELNDWLEATEVANIQAETIERNFRFSPVDLEYSMLASANEPTATEIALEIGLTAQNSRELMRKLGSKVDGSAVNNSTKAAWMRGVIGQKIPNSQVHCSVRKILKLWVVNASDRTTAETLVDASW